MSPICVYTVDIQVVELARVAQLAQAKTAG